MLNFNWDLYEKEAGNYIKKSEWEALSPEEKEQEKARRIRMAYCWRGVSSFPDKRQQAIIDCAVDDVTQKEVMNVVSLCRKAGYSELAVGKIRTHYDDIIDDMEKKVRKEFGLENDYTHTIAYGYLSYPPYRRTIHIDGIPKMFWGMLYAPEHVVPKRASVLAAINWFESEGYTEEADSLKVFYSNIIQVTSPATLTTFEERLLGDPDYVHENISNIYQAIRRMERHGFTKEANIVREKYGYLLAKDRPPPKCTLEEADALFKEIMEGKFP